MPEQAITYRIKELPRRIQPRELFDKLGAEHVADDVLLAILLRSGVPGRNVLELAGDLLAKYQSLTALTRVTARELTSFRGIGPTKARELKAALELARRLSQECVDVDPGIHTPEDVARLFRDAARELDHEQFWVVLLDTRNRRKGPPRLVSRGLLNASLVHAREVFADAVQHRAAAVVLAHNHPSGDTNPSPEDLKITRELVAAGKILGVEVLDHVIVGQPGSTRSSYFLSLRESGLVSFS